MGVQPVLFSTRIDDDIAVELPVITPVQSLLRKCAESCHDIDLLRDLKSADYELWDASNLARDDEDMVTFHDSTSDVRSTSAKCGKRPQSGILYMFAPFRVISTSCNKDSPDHQPRSTCYVAFPSLPTLVPNSRPKCSEMLLSPATFYSSDTFQLSFCLKALP